MRYFNVDIVTAFPEQPKRFVTLASTHCASGLISDLVNCGVRPQSLQQLLHTKRLIMPTFTVQRDVVLVYEMKLGHSIREASFGVISHED